MVYRGATSRVKQSVCRTFRSVPCRVRDGLSVGREEDLEDLNIEC